MTTEIIEHITSDGDRWDLLAWEYYGDPLAYERIIVANPHCPIYPILPSGIVLDIPVIDANTPASTDNQPPWVRA